MAQLPAPGPRPPTRPHVAGYAWRTTRGERLGGGASGCEAQRCGTVPGPGLRPPTRPHIKLVAAGRGQKCHVVWCVCFRVPLKLQRQWPSCGIAPALPAGSDLPPAPGAGPALRLCMVIAGRACQGLSSSDAACAARCLAPGSALPPPPPHQGVLRSKWQSVRRHWQEGGHSACGLYVPCY